MGVIAIIATGLTVTERATRYCKSNEVLKTSSCSYLNSLFCIFATFCQQGKLALAKLTTIKMLRVDKTAQVISGI
jgi:hypothetical protein